MTSRMQITLDRGLQRRVAKKAAAQGISIAEYVRRAVSADLGDAPRKADIASIFDLGRSLEPTDISRDKKRLIAESLAAKAK